MARRTKAEAEATREALLDAAEEVFFEKGVACTSLEQIARHAGMTRGAVYWHFRNKADLFRAMLDRVRMPFEELVAETAPSNASPLEAIRLGCQQGFHRLEQPRHRRVHATLLHRCEFFSDIDPRALESEMASECLDALLIYLRKAQDQGLLREDLSPENATRLLQATLSGLFHDWLRDPEAFSLYKYGTQLVDIQLRLFERDSASS
ncbi:TetR family transcriptional regulator [Halomonas elongata]|uniref:TetR family transcription regulator n=1 Tax=Halomonas elongata (strain ATCC 33173 / DSM 2581 / NBRC 15536 / NCIMB 2198 / 1H9) TaxID=768066 RepID=E1V4S0_HALED|nr:TetR family transcriptional regulator [Halomonas elongata]WBF16750.1 TetR family transcriptional regulator [Halomonas elongata]WPU45581.1 TetR family transcriptional regulator [Halomonas elongata DSM 2581]CBV43008.1 TetR family transcription regulator [Halomonas elongata DSM 2581]